MRQLQPAGGRRTAATLVIALGVAACGAGQIGLVSATADDAVSPAAEKLPAAEAPANNESPNSATKAGRNPMPLFTPEREAAAVTFVTAHHPELAPLLAHLKISRPSEYQKAIRKLFVDSERLAHSREMQPRRYELELQEWKLESRAQLLVARLTMKRTPELEAELRRVLSDQMEVQSELLNLDRERLTQKVAAIDKEIKRLNENRDEQLEDRFQRALKSVGQRKQTVKPEKSEK